MASPESGNNDAVLSSKVAARYSHPQRLARTCQHALHPCAPRYPYCTKCTLSTARTRLAEAETELRRSGGMSPAAHARNQSWCTARLVYEVAVRRMREAARRSEAEERRVREWEQAHGEADLANVSEGQNADAESPCPICLIKTLNVSADAPDGNHWAAVDRDVTWWEKPNTRASDETASHQSRSISPWRRNRRQGKKPAKPRPSTQRKPSIMADIILHHRIELSMQETFEYGPNLLRKIEWTFRRKFDCFGMQVDPRMWSMPYSAIRMRPAPVERVAHRPFRRVVSGLSQVEGIDEFEVSEETRRWEEEERMRGAEMKARKQVGCLFLVGKSEDDLAAEVGADFFMSFRRGRAGELPVGWSGVCMDDADAGVGSGDESPEYQETGEDDSEGEDKENERFEEYYTLSSSEEDYEEEYSDEEYSDDEDEEEE